MTTLAFFFYLLLFYVLPWRGVALYEWVWVHAPMHFPRLVWPGCNGAFYLEMWLWGLGFLGLASLLDWAARRDDPAWAGLFRALGRHGGLGRAYALLGLLCVALIVPAMTGGHPLHGLISLTVTLLTTLLLPALFSGGRVRRRPAPASSPAAPGAPPPAAPDTLAAEARPLQPDDFPAPDPNALTRRVHQALVPNAAASPLRE